MMKLKKRYVIILVILLVVILLFVLGKRTKKVHYETQKVERCTITQVVEASGTINPVNTVSVGSTVSGLIKEIYVDFNSEVKKGQVLAQIDPANFQASVDQANAQINNAEANLAKLQALTDMSKKTYNRYKNLYAKNFIAKSELDKAESEYLSNMAQIKAQRASISQARATHKTAMTNLSYTRIVAPVDGTIISRKIDLGQPVAASFQAPELFTIAQDLTKMQIEVNVSEADIGKVKNGQEVTYTLDGYPDSVFDGKVTQVRISPTTVSNVVTYVVIVDVDNENLHLIPGMTANVSIITEKKENVLCAPNLALKFTPNSDMQKYKNQGVWVLEKRKPVRIDIKQGANDDSKFEIISDKIQEGDLILTGSNNGKQKNKSSQPRPPRMF